VEPPPRLSANRNLPETRAVGKTTFVKCKRSQAAFAASSAYDRIAFARWNRSNRTVRVPSREKRQKTGPRRSTRHFLQCGSKARPTELPRFPSILAVIQPYFSATQTVWRRDWDSNLRYPFTQAAKARCVQYIRRILQHRRLIRRMALKPEFGKEVPFLTPPKGERLAIVGVKTQVSGPAPCANWLAHDCAPTAQSI
jgi:hypothetical protein